MYFTLLFICFTFVKFRFKQLLALKMSITHKKF